MLLLKAFMKRYYWLYILIVVGFTCGALIATQTVSVMAISKYESIYTEIVIDPGHGGEDGGAVSCSGVRESKINLEISLKLNDLLHFLGYKTVMTRLDEQDLATEGETVAQRKLSDLKNRVSIANKSQNGLLISIHQNQFEDDRYSGAQVFYGSQEGSRELAEQLQKKLITTINPGSNREAKKSEGVYLMQHIFIPGILVECGFLSNIQEEARLRDVDYQRQVCCVIAGAVSEFLQKSDAPGREG